VTAGQEPTADAPAFEVATVRENRSGETRSRIELVNARFNATNMTLRELVAIAYPAEGGAFRHASELVGGPGWFNSARFDIVASADGFRGDTNRPGFTTTAADRASVERVRQMLQRPAGRTLRAAPASRDSADADLRARDGESGGALGPDLRRSTRDCLEEWKTQGKPDARNVACGSIQGARPGSMAGQAAEIGPLVRSLWDWTGRPVIDRTGLTGRFDFTLRWSPEGSTDTDAPSIFTAVQEQLGLKLEPATGPVDVLVVDAAERPAVE
jgi:hypothetical protein